MHTNSRSLTTTTMPSPDAELQPSAPGDAEMDVEVLRSVPKEFAIDCEAHANWLVRKIVSARAYAERVKEWCEQELRRAAREEQTLMFLFSRQAEAWARGEIEKLNGRRKSLSLPAGVLGFRTVNPSLQVDDEQVVLIWAKANCPEAVVRAHGTYSRRGRSCRAGRGKVLHSLI
jgi:hypothetical protein